MFNLGKASSKTPQKVKKAVAKPAKGSLSRASPGSATTSSTSSSLTSQATAITPEPFKKKRAREASWMQHLPENVRTTLDHGIKQMKKDDPVLFCRWSTANFNFKRPAANNGGIVTLNNLADLIEQHGGTRIDGSNYAFAFTNMGVLLACKQQVLATAPWVRHVNTTGLTAAQRAALGALSRPICDEVILVSQAPTSGAVVAAHFAEFFM